MGRAFQLAREPKGAPHYSENRATASLKEREVARRVSSGPIGSLAIAVRWARPLRRRPQAAPRMADAGPSGPWR